MSRCNGSVFACLMEFSTTMNLVATLSAERNRPGHGVVAIVPEAGKFLVIRRSPQVRAPNMLCFAGGTIEPGETPEQAIVRELHEELGLVARPRQHVWQSRTAWGTLLEWVLVERREDSQPVANLAEVSEWMWIGAEELLVRPDLLPSVPAFFKAWAQREFELPLIAGQPRAQWCDLP
jgi:8-oxo-dGTP diphosphatase